MSASTSVAANLPPDIRKEIAIQVLSKSEPVSHLSAKHQVSRKFVYELGDKAQQAVDDTFAPSQDEREVLFYLPITKNWLFQFILALVLICHCSYRGVVELFRDLFGLHISVGTVHNRLQSAAVIASEVNQAQDLSRIKVGLHDEIFQGSQPVLAGIDAASTYCYLLQGVEHRDEESWGWHLLDAMAQGFKPDYTIADGGLGLRAGQKAVMGEIPCHGDVFHILHQCQNVANSLSRQAMSATAQRQALEQEMSLAKQKGRGNRVSKKLNLAHQRETTAIALQRDVKTLIQWLNQDVLELAGPSLAERQELYDFVTAELDRREAIGGKKVRALRKALQNQRNDMLAFAQVLDDKLDEISQRLKIPLYLVRQMCLLFHKQPTSNAYWQVWKQLHQKLCGQFHHLYAAVQEAMRQTPRASSLVENLNSRLRNYFFLRKQLGSSYLNLLQFFLNHRRFIRSDCEERVGKSPSELMTGERHPHWLELLGFSRFQQA